MRSRTRRMLLLPAMVALFGTLAISGCGEQDEPTSERKSSRVEKSAKPTPESTSTPELEQTTQAAPAPIVLPGTCEAMNPAFYAIALQHPSGQGAPVTPTPGADATEFQYLGPIAKTTLQQAIQVNNCHYSESTGSGGTQWVAELPVDARNSFIDVLRADGAFTETALSGATQFRFVDTSYGQLPTFDYIFVGDNMLVVIAGPMVYPDNYTQPAIDALRALNPSLGNG